MNEETGLTAATGLNSAFSRRSLMASAAVLAAGAALLPMDLTGALAAKPNPNSVLAGLDYAEFNECVGQRFRAKDGSSSTGLDLTAATMTNSTPGQECFQLTFTRVRGLDLQQGTYTMANTLLGRFPLFIVPNGDGRTYVAIVNRMAAAA